MKEMNKNKRNSILGSLSIIFITMCWGVSFVFMKTAMDVLSPLWLLSLRFTLAAALLWLLLGKRACQINRRALKCGCMIGIPLFSAYLLQTYGLAMTTAGNSAVITGTYVVFVPLLAWMITRKIRLPHLVLGFLTLAALAVFSLSDSFTIGLGDVLTFGCAMMYCLHILAIDHFGMGQDPLTMAALQISFAALLDVLLAFFFEPMPSFAFSREIWGSLLFMAIFCTAIAFFVQTAAQKVLTPAATSVLLTGECLFGAIAGWWLLDEMFSPRQFVGATVLILCMLISVYLSNKATLQQKPA